jgi:endogenous inhibitor of DNA gyrase (YacG/DUF329 family)
MFSANCPHCGGRIRWDLIRTRFRCPICGTPLVASTTRAILVAIALCLVPEALFHIYVAPLALRIALKCVVVLLILAWSLGRMSALREAPR